MMSDIAACRQLSHIMLRRARFDACRRGAENGHDDHRTQDDQRVSALSHHSAVRTEGSDSQARNQPKTRTRTTEGPSALLLGRVRSELHENQNLTKCD